MLWMVRLDKPLASDMAAVVRQIYRRCWALRLLVREAKGESEGRAKDLGDRTPYHLLWDV